MINRRSFTKRVLGIATLSVAGIAKILKPKPEPIFRVPLPCARLTYDLTVTDVTTTPNQAVCYGVAGMDYDTSYLKGQLGLVMKAGYRSEVWIIEHWAINYYPILVNCPELIRKGQTLVWYPDGTVRGVEYKQG